MGVFTQSVPRGFREKLYEVNWAFVLLILLMALVAVLLAQLHDLAEDLGVIAHGLGLGIAVHIAVIVEVVAAQAGQDRDIDAENLPYGDKRRLEIAIALASEPDLLLMDEPTAGMSPHETSDTVDLIERVKEELGLTLIFVEHDMEIVFSISDRIVVLDRGRVIADGSPEEVRGHEDVQEAYLGGEEI